jgi:uncharacterized protein
MSEFPASGSDEEPGANDPPAPAPDDVGHAEGLPEDADAASPEPVSHSSAVTVAEATEIPDAGEAPDAGAEDAPPEDGAAASVAPADEPDASATAAPAEEGSKPPRPAARQRARERLGRAFGKVSPAGLDWTLAALEHGLEPPFIARFRRDSSGGLDERRVREVRDAWREILGEERRRDELRERIDRCQALTPAIERALERARGVPEMEDVAAPWLPVPGGRATVARGRGLGALAEAIRDAKEGTPPLSELAQPFVKEGSEVPSLDAALAGARDVLAEEIGLDPALRARLRDLFRRESVFSVALRDDRRGDPGRHGAFVGFSAPLAKVPPMKLLAVRRGERERVLASSIEPPEEKAVAIAHAALGERGTSHPFAGFLRAAAEDAYRRILRPLLQAELRAQAKAHADDAALDSFDRAYRNLLLGPVGGPRRTLGLVPDVTGGHRGAAVDERGQLVWSGRLPHEATAGREAAVEALREALRSHDVSAVAVAAAAGRKEVAALVRDAVGSSPVEVVEVPDGGTRALEAEAVAKPARTEGGGEIPPEFLGAVSIARRFQDPLAEYVRLDARSLGLGPHVHDVHQGRLQSVLDDAARSCVAHAGVDATTAHAELLARVPGFDAEKAKAFVAWRDGGNALASKAALAAVDGVGPVVAERAVGFLRIPNARDPRDRTMLHPEQFGLLDEMAAQVGGDVAALFREPRLRARVQLAPLARPDAPMSSLKYALYQATAGAADPRPRHAVPVRPPPGFSLASVRPGMMLEGRVVRAVPFGVFLDVGLEAEALVPLAHLGDRPGVEPATVAPVGAVVHGRVIEIDPAKKRIALSMREDVLREGPPGRRDHGGPPPRGGRGRGPDRPPPFAGGPPRDREPEPAGAGGAGGPAGRRPRSFGPDAPARGDQRGGKGGGRGREERPSSKAPVSFSAMVRPPRPTAGAGVEGRGGGRGRGDGRRFERDDPGAPRRISLPADAPPPSDATEAELTPEQVLAKKLEELKRKLARPE